MSGTRVRRRPMRGAGREQRRLVGEVAVDGRAAHAGVLGQRAHRRARRAERPVQRDRALGDALPRVLLELGAALHPVGTLFVGHRCPMNLDTSSGRRYIGATPLSNERNDDDGRRRRRRWSGPRTASRGSLGSIGVRFMIDGDETERRLLARRAPDAAARAGRAAAPPPARGRVQLRARGRMGALLGDEVLEARPRRPVFKPRDQWHTFWNAGDEPAGSSRSSPRRASSASSRSSSTSAAR